MAFWLRAFWRLGRCKYLQRLHQGDSEPQVAESPQSCSSRTIAHFTQVQFAWSEHAQEDVGHRSVVEEVSQAVQKVTAAKSGMRSLST